MFYHLSIILLTKSHHADILYKIAISHRISILLYYTYYHWLYNQWCYVNNNLQRPSTCMEINQIHGKLIYIAIYP